MVQIGRRYWLRSPWIKKLWLKDAVGKTLHSKLLNTITLEITEGRLKAGSRLPSSRSLAVQLDVNRKTVQQVYEELEAQGWLQTRSRSGTFVSDVLPEQGLSISDAEVLNCNERTLSSSELLDSLYQDSITPVTIEVSNNDGVPDTRLIPYELLARTYRRVCIELNRSGKLGYTESKGSIELRSAVASMLSNERYMNCTSDEVCIVRGSQMGIYLASRILDPAKGAIVVEELCYLPARTAFEANGFTVLSCKLDEYGLVIDDLINVLKDHSIAALYLTPHHQYPTTVTLPMERRLALLKLSKDYRFVVLEDDYDHEFHYESNPIPPLASLPNSENVVHIGSMSKVFAPGMRLGYIAANKAFIERAAQEILLIDRQGNAITELVLAHLMENGEVKRHIRKNRKEYEGRRDFAASEFVRVFGKDVSFKIPTGGMAIWVDISKLVRGRKLNELPSKDSTLSSLYTNEQEIPTHIRFGYGALKLTEITKSIERLSSFLAF